MPVNTDRINELLTQSRVRLDDLTSRIAAHEREAAQLRRDALATHGAVQVLEVLAAESQSANPPAEIVPLNTAPNAT